MNKGANTLKNPFFFDILAFLGLFCTFPPLKGGDMKIKESFYHVNIRIDVFEHLKSGLDSQLKSGTWRLRKRDPVN